jgi:hypothetical protein
VSVPFEEVVKAVRLWDTAKALSNLLGGIVLISSADTVVSGVPTLMNPSNAAQQIARLRNLLDQLEASIDADMQKQRGEEPGTFIAEARACLRQLQEGKQ